MKFTRHYGLTFSGLTIVCAVCLLFSGVTVAGSDKPLRWTVDDLLEDKPRPFVIGHRGYGENLGEDPDKPIENTVESVRRAFKEGVSIVEVDVVMTADNVAVALHDDYLSDLTCVNTLTFGELKQLLPYVPSLRQILNAAKQFSLRNPGKHGESISGLVNIEVKTPAPLCDPDDATEAALVASVLRAVDKTNSSGQVIIEAFSPVILSMFAAEAPAVKRNFSINMLQLLSEEQVEEITGLPVTLIDKADGFGLQWAEIGVFFRLPGYTSIDEYINVALALGAQLVTLDKLIPALLDSMQPGGAVLLVGQIHSLGLNATVYTVDTETEWLFMSEIGIDGIYTNDIPMGLSLEGSAE
ncbi:MAG: glycerophosphodiester phosphodiesterase [Gammaproteobacteria bacterium]|nr:glycerophosphodiester phosphodiesterase [Gammaproteobacteria bacterium]